MCHDYSTFWGKGRELRRLSDWETTLACDFLPNSVRRGNWPGRACACQRWQCLHNAPQICTWSECSGRSSTQTTDGTLGGEVAKRCTYSPKYLQILPVWEQGSLHILRRWKAQWFRGVNIRSAAHVSRCSSDQSCSLQCRMFRIAARTWCAPRRAMKQEFAAYERSLLFGEPSLHSLVAPRSSLTSTPCDLCRSSRTQPQPKDHQFC